MTRVDWDPMTAIESLTQKVGQLESVCDRLTHDNEKLRAALLALSAATPTADAGGARLKTSSAQQPDSAETGGASSGTESPRRGMSRRGMLATAAGMAAAAAGGSILAEGLADPAAAATGALLGLGVANDAESPTTVSYDGTTGGLSGGVMFLANDTPDAATEASYPAALGGWAGAPGSPAGVANGIYGFTDNGAGNAVVAINGASTGSGSGVLAMSDNASTEATAVLGIITSNDPGSLSAALRGQNNGLGGAGIGVWGSQAGSGWGVYGTSAAGVGVYGTGAYGVAAEGSLAPLLLYPGIAAGPPTTGTHLAGELFVDSNGRLYYCLEGGTPGTWVKMTPLVPVSPPKRAYDSRTHDGPLPGGNTRNVSLASGGLPAGASLALINLTVVRTVGAGYLSLYEEGTSAPSPLTSNINWYASGQTIANNATVAVNSSGGVTVQAGGTTDFVIDVFGFYF
jgi:hypothetical protein